MPFATENTQPVEDINAVLGRFEAWAGKPAKPGTGAREISYEEAVQSSRYRRAGRTPLPPLAAKPVSNARQKSASVEKTKVQTVKAAPPQEKPAEAARGAQRASSSRKSASEKRPPAAQKSAAAQPQFRQILETSVAAETMPAPVKSAPVKSVPLKARPTEARPTEAKPPTLGQVAEQRRALDPARPVMLSVRLSGPEQALIRTRAQEANVSISAYMRQCALEVEQLRDQVERTLAAMQRGTPQQPSTTAPPRFFARVAQRIFGIRTGATLVLRA